jgi:hypothetical protein
MATNIGWHGSLREFREQDTDSLVGVLTSASRFNSIEREQVGAWRESLGWLSIAVSQLMSEATESTDWGLILEYEIPRRGYRIDAVVIADGVIIPIEFKSSSADLRSQRQAEDYGLELADFHRGSRGLIVAPILCAGEAHLSISRHNKVPESKVVSLSMCPPDGLRKVIYSLAKHYRDSQAITIKPKQWVESKYEPTPTIVEAATALYAGHKIEDLTQSDSSAKQLLATQYAIRSEIEYSKSTGQKTICFITGVPGAGKTLAGLNVVNAVADTEATFLSGNGPLVRILQEALAVDHSRRNGTTKSESRRRSSTFVTNVHRWLDEYVDDSPDSLPLEHVVVFDEAQRAWSREHSKRKFDRDASEPEMMLSVMDRHPDWSLLVALVGGGQEINTGEAGLGEWGRALEAKFQHWRIAVSPELLEGGEVTAGSTLFDSVPEYAQEKLSVNKALHLSVSSRSFRTTKLNSWVEAVLDGNADSASKIASQMSNFPLAVSRDLDQCRKWLRDHARGLRTSGLVATSGARRLRPYGIDVTPRLEARDWFLRDKDDVRSSDYLELAATEFDIQGLELDWVGLCWGGDLRYDNYKWLRKQFRGTKWSNINTSDAQVYALNKYRVLLTRAREGLIIWVPPGSASDPTRSADIYDPTYDFLVNAGMERIE